MPPHPPSLKDRPRPHCPPWPSQGPLPQAPLLPHSRPRQPPLYGVCQSGWGRLLPVVQMPLKLALAIRWLGKGWVPRSGVCAPRISDASLWKGVIDVPGRAVGLSTASAI